MSPKHLQRLQDLDWVCILMIRNQGNMVGRVAKSFGYSASVVLKFPVAASAHLRGHFCLQIKSGDGKQVQTEDNEQLRIWRRLAKPVLWDISNKLPLSSVG